MELKTGWSAIFCPLRRLKAARVGGKRRTGDRLINAVIKKQLGAWERGGQLMA
jgi:hypothetical protein